MDENTEDTPDRVGDLRIRSEEIGFAPDEMIACKKCEKVNPPTRTNCLYCGEGLDNRVESVGDVTLNVRELEGWEKGFNVVILDSSRGDANAAAGLAQLFGVESEMIEPILSSGKHVPVARMESEGAAFSVGELLSRSGIETKIVPDEALQPTVPHVRLRGMTFDEGVLLLELFNSGDVVAVNHDDIALIVPGILRTDRTELMEQRKRRETKTLNETQITSSSEQVIDIYSRLDPVGWRVRSNGFDFSCLDDKSLLVIDNMDRLKAKLAGISTSITVVDDFAANESLLRYSWPTEYRKDVYGFQRSGFSRKDLSSVVTVNNELQLTKYSRLQWQLL